MEEKEGNEKKRQEWKGRKSSDLQVAKVCLRMELY